MCKGERRGPKSCDPSHSQERLVEGSLNFSSTSMEAELNPCGTVCAHLNSSQKFGTSGYQANDKIPGSHVQLCLLLGDQIPL